MAESKYKVGDPLYIATGFGGEPHVTVYHVERVTPSGQVVARAGVLEVRLTAYGAIVGADKWSHRRVVTGENAERLLAASKVRAKWDAIQAAAEKVAAIAHKRDAQELEQALTKLNEAASRARGETSGEVGA